MSNYNEVKNGKKYPKKGANLSMWYTRIKCEKRVFKKIKKKSKKVEINNKKQHRLFQIKSKSEGRRINRETRRSSLPRADASSPSGGKPESTEAKRGAGATSVVRPLVRRKEHERAPASEFARPKGAGTRAQEWAKPARGTAASLTLLATDPRLKLRDRREQPWRGFGGMKKPAVDDEEAVIEAFECKRHWASFERRSWNVACKPEAEGELV